MMEEGLIPGAEVFPMVRRLHECLQGRAAQGKKSRPKV